MMEDTSAPLIETEDIEQKNLSSSIDIKLEDSPLETKQEDIQEEKVEKKETDKAEEKEIKKEEEEEEEDDDDEDDFEIIPTLAAMSTSSEWEQGAKHDFTETTNTASRRLSIKEYESDPWAEPESGLLLETEEVQESTPVLSAVEDDNSETMSEVKEPLDQDTSPLKVILDIYIYIYLYIPLIHVFARVFKISSQPIKLMI
jgi:hypothetical protein